MRNGLRFRRPAPGSPGQDAQRDPHPLLQELQHGVPPYHGSHQPLADGRAARQGPGRDQGRVTIKFKSELPT